METCSFRAWLLQTTEDDDDDEHAALPLIDIRETTKDHLSTIPPLANRNNNTIIVSLPFSSLLSGERSCELPPRQVEFGILMETEMHNDDDFMKEVQAFFFRTTSKTTSQSRVPWRVSMLVVLNEEDKLFLCNEETSHSNNSSASDDSSCFRVQPRLWQPDPMVQTVLWPALRERLRTLFPRKQQHHHQRDEKIDCSRNFEIWDLGSGAGRDVCFLAEHIKDEMMKTSNSSSHSQQDDHQVPVTIVGIDNHKASAQRCMPFWKNRGVSDVTRPLLLDLNKLPLVDQAIRTAKATTEETCCSQNQAPVNQVASILCFYAVRFLNRKLVRHLAMSTMVETGTLFATSHFCKPYEGATWDFDHPKEKRVLERDELGKLFKESGWEVLHDDLIHDSDHGRTLIQFLARKSK